MEAITGGLISKYFAHIRSGKTAYYMVILLEVTLFSSLATKSYG